MTRPEIEAEAKQLKKQLYDLVVIASKECRCVGKEIMPHVERIVELRSKWKLAK